VSTRVIAKCIKREPTPAIPAWKLFILHAPQKEAILLKIRSLRAFLRRMQTNVGVSTFKVQAA
jgi:hypothetical protein